MKHVRVDELPEQPVSHNASIRKRVMLQAGEIPHVTGFSQAIFPPGEVAGLHVHDDMHELFFIMQGSGHMRVNDNEFPLSEGSCIQVAPGEAHEIINSGETDLVICYFGVGM